MEMSRDAGSIPAASTQTGCTTRLDSNKARQDNLAGLACLVRVFRDLRHFAEHFVTKSRDHPSGEIARKVSNWPKSLETV